ncbi:hypothetical protein Tco_1295921 [Tanacetum coccineum]
MMSWPIISSSFTCKVHVDHGHDNSPWLTKSVDRHSRHVPERTVVSQSIDIFEDCITQGWSHKRVVIIGWSDIKCISEKILVKIELLLIQLTAVQPSR